MLWALENDFLWVESEIRGIIVYALSLMAIEEKKLNRLKFNILKYYLILFV